MKILTLTSLFPGAAAPRHGVFVKERMRDYRARFAAEVRVVAPVPFYPRFLPGGRFASFARAPQQEEFEGFPIAHPRYLMIPKLGVPVQGWLYEQGVRATVVRERRLRGFDLLDVHYAYPDGFAGALLKRRLGVPMVLTVRGTDVNLLPRLRATRRQVRFALRAADAVVAVSRALADHAVRAGADPSRVTVLRNGVDVEVFEPLDRDACRASLGVPTDARVLASVGQLIARKGHDLVIGALARFAPARRPVLLVAGEGQELGNLRALAARTGVGENVRFLGAVAHENLASVYGAADFLVLASSREGMANVLLESLACGTPVIASTAEGSAEVIDDPEVGLLVEERTADAFAAAVANAFARPFDRSRVRRHAEGRTWQATSEGLDVVFRRVLHEHGGART